MLVVVAGLVVWQRVRNPGLPDGFAYGNGRIEATEYDVATKRSGRLEAVLVAEGDMVEAGQVLARMDTKDLEAQLRGAEARVAQAREDRRRAMAAVLQRESDLRSATAAVAQRRSALGRADAAIAQRRSEAELARKSLQRSQALFDEQLIPRQQLDQDLSAAQAASALLAQERAARHAAEAALAEAEAQRQAAEAALTAARIDVNFTEAAIAAATAEVERISTEIADSALTSPIDGRVLYRLAEPGEVLSAGGRVVTVLDLRDVYMTIFLPTEQAGRTAIGAEARIVLDAAPQHVIPATVSFVASRSQFTPKAVETRSERETLMFRVKVRIDPDLLARYEETVKTGLPGVAYVRLDPNAEWPEFLEVNLPQ
ncbi:MAG TPA: HlyD family efflux transporter periplasmic adaptor subunit [Thermodesulfobacteriota bacterium]